MKLSSKFSNFMRIRPEDNVSQSVAEHFKHNVIVNTMDLVFFMLGDSFVSINTIMPVFAATLTDSPFLIGLIPAIANAGWFIPQMFLSGHVSRLKKKLPFTLKMAIVERIPYLLFPILALSIPKISVRSAIFGLLFLSIFRGLASGLTALPWQEMMARVIPISHRSRMWGFSRVAAQIVGLLGSFIAAIVLGGLKYPNNYALIFAFAVVSQWISFIFYSRNLEPETEDNADCVSEAAQPNINFRLFRRIIGQDANLRYYLAGRSIAYLGNMASGFLAVYGIQHFELADDQAAIFTGLLFLSGILGYTFGGVLGDKIGPKRIILVAIGFWLAAMIAAIIAPVIWLYYLVFLFFGLYNSGMIMGDSILVMELGREDLRPSYLGIARTFTGIFVLIAPILAGWIVSSFGYNAMFMISMILALIGAYFLNKVHDVPRGVLKSAKNQNQSSNS